MFGWLAVCGLTGCEGSPGAVRPTSELDPEPTRTATFGGGLEGRIDATVPDPSVPRGEPNDPCEPRPLWWPDGDGDGFGDATCVGGPSSSPAPGFVGNGLDCDDMDASIRPAAWPDAPLDAVDTNCDGFDRWDLVAGTIRIRGGAPGRRVGERIDVGPDLDGDGLADLVVGVPEDDAGGFDAGSVRVWPGALLASQGADLLLDDAPLAIVGALAGDRVGCFVASVDDLDSDGTGELVVGQGCESGGALGLISGATLVAAGSGTPSLAWTTVDLDAVGTPTLARTVPDLDGDGLPELAVGVPAGAGFVAFWSGAALALGGTVDLADTMLILQGRQWTIEECAWYGGFPYCGPTVVSEGLGQTLTVVGDVDGDGLPELVAGSRFSASSGTRQTGGVHLFNGARLAAGGSIDSSEATLSYVGTPTVGLTGAFDLAADLDGDGLPEWVLGTASGFGLALSPHPPGSYEAGDLDARWVLPPGGSPLPPKVGDRDGDGSEEVILVVAGGAAAALPAAAGCGSSTLWEVHSLLSGSPAPQQIEGAPTSNFAGLDRAVGGRCWEDLPAGLPGVLEPCVRPDGSIGAIASGDWNGDGLLDVALGRSRASDSDDDEGEILLFPSGPRAAPPQSWEPPCEPADGGDDDSTPASGLSCAAGLVVRPGDLRIHTHEDAAGFCSSWNAVEGAAAITGRNVTDSGSLACLCDVGGTLHAVGADLVDLSLPNLSEVGGLELRGSTALATLNLPLLGAVPGTVRVHDLPALTSLSGLGALETVDKLIIGDTAATSTSALSALWEVAGDLSVSGPSLNSINLPSLSRVGGTMAVHGWAALGQVGPFPALTEVGGLRISRQAGPGPPLFWQFASLALAGDIAALPMVAAALEFPSLEQAEDITLQVGAIPTLLLPHLVLAESILVQSGSYVSVSAPKLQSASVALRAIPGLAVVDLPALAHAPALSFQFLPSLASVTLPALAFNDSFVVQQSSLLGEISVPNLSATELISLSGLPTLAALHAPTLESAGEISLFDLPTLKGLDGLPALQWVGNLSIQALPQLESLDGLTALAEVDGVLQLVALPALSSLGVLGQLNGPPQDLVLSNIAVAPPALPLWTLLDELHLASLPLESLAPFVNLQQVGGSVVLLGNDELLDLDGLGNLQSIAGDLRVSQNDLLGSLDGLSGLRFVGGGLVLTQNAVLADLSGLAGTASVGGAIQISTNPALSQSHAASIVAGIASVGGPVVISGGIP